MPGSAPLWHSHSCYVSTKNCPYIYGLNVKAVKCIKNSNPKSFFDTLAERQATRSKVSNVVITAKAVAKITEGTLRSDAAKNVLEATND